MLLRNTNDKSTNFTSPGRRRAFLAKAHYWLQGKTKADYPSVDQENLNIGTWNIRTMFESGKTAQVASEMHNYNLVVLGFCETRWKKSGQLRLTTGDGAVFRTNAGTDEPVTLEGKELGEVESFTYFGSVVENRGKQTHSIGRQAPNWNPQGQRKRGRPRNT